MSMAAQGANKKPDPSAKPATGPGGYEVARPHGQCARCDATIEPDQKLMAALRETPEGFERIDVCLNCWEEFDRANVLAFWKTTMPRPEAKKKLFVDDEVLCDLFERLGTAEEPSKLNFRFVLGLILMRKRLLSYESSRTDDAGRELWKMRFRGRQDTLEMLNPHLTEEQVQDVSRQLGDILNEEL